MAAGDGNGDGRERRRRKAERQADWPVKRDLEWE
jgi:hypothetical protein